MFCRLKVLLIQLFPEALLVLFLLVDAKCNLASVFKLSKLITFYNILKIPDSKNLHRKTSTFYKMIQSYNQLEIFQYFIIRTDGLEFFEVFANLFVL